jgi:UrcA family protein
MYRNFFVSNSQEEVPMYSKTAFMNSRLIIGATAVAAALFAGSVSAKEPVSVAYQVTTQGLDVSQSAGARELYQRLQHAATIVCTHGMRVDLASVPDPQGCYEKALADAVRSAKLPLLTQVYLVTHTRQEAAARGIDMSQRVATK